MSFDFEDSHPDKYCKALKSASQFLVYACFQPNTPFPLIKVFYGVKPDEKSKFISRLQKDHHVVAMVGDGINDAATLASSHVGIAIGGGVGVASEVASIVLMSNKISQLIDALELTRQTMKTVKQNLWWAFGYNIVRIPIAAGTSLPVTGLMLTPSIAEALMGLPSKLVEATESMHMGWNIMGEISRVPASRIMLMEC